MRSMIIMHRPICRRTDVRGRYPDRRQPVMDNMTAKVSCFARAYHFENNKTHICILEKWRIVRKYKMTVVNRMNS